MNIPDPLKSEFELKNHVEAILGKNKSCNENISFLGGGCAPHYVPAICDEINHRSEFLTAYAGAVVNSWIVLKDLKDKLSEERDPKIFKIYFEHA